jgi:RNA methyltransferase, TrmH family
MISKQKVKYIQSLQHKKFRDADKVFVAEGPKVVAELTKLLCMKTKLKLYKILS